MGNQIDLRKPLSSKQTPWIEWHGWTTGTRFAWLQQLHRLEAQVQVGDIKEGGRTYANLQAAMDAFRDAITKKLDEGFWYEGARPPNWRRKPSKPAKPAKRSTPLPHSKAKAPRWLAKVDPKELGRIRTAIKRAKLEHRRADLESLLRPSIRLMLKAVNPASIKGVVTRFGGDPDLPRGFKWPIYGKNPLAFLAQYRLDELAPLDLERRLPRRGLLAVFAHLVPSDGYGEHAVAFHFPDVKVLARTAPPHAAEADGRPSKVAVATATLNLTLPPPDHSVVRALKLGDEADRYHDEVWLAICAGRDNPSQPGAHQLLGWPDAMTDYVARKGWELLAQIDSDDRFGFELGDVETLRVHVASHKLAAADFRGVKATTMTD